MKVISTDKFQLYSKKIKIDKSITKKNKFERIKNKYICPRKNNILNEIEADSMSESKSLTQESYSQLVIDHEYNLSYFTFEEYTPQQHLSLYSDNFWNSTRINTKYNPEGFFSVIIANIILIILLFILIIVTFLFNKILLNHFGYFIIKVWLLSSLFIYIILYPLLYYIKNLIGSLLLFKFYHLKNRTLFYKVFFRIFADKITIYIFKVRNYVTKYAKELNY